MASNRVAFGLAFTTVGASIVVSPNMVGVLGAALSIAMIAIAVIDRRDFIIPDQLNAAGLVLGLVHAAMRQPDWAAWAAATAILRGAFLAFLFLAIRIIYARLRGRQGLGLGDVKLAAVAGTWLDWLVIPIWLELAVLAALGELAAHRVVRRQSISLSHRLPFGFFLAPSIWVCWLADLIWLSHLHID